MIHLGAGIKSRLDADSGVGAIAGDRNYPMLVPPEVSATLPLNIFSVSYSAENNLGNTPYDTAIVSVSAWSTDYDEAHALANANEAALHGVSGSFGGASVRHFVRRSREDGVGQITEDSHAFVVTSTFEVLISN